MIEMSKSCFWNLLVSNIPWKCLDNYNVKVSLTKEREMLKISSRMLEMKWSFEEEEKEWSEGGEKRRRVICMFN